MSRRDNKSLPSKKVSPPKRLVIMNPSKGLNNLVSPSLIDNKEFSDMQNMEYDEGGVIRKRAGYVTAGNTLTAARGLGVYATEASNYMVTLDGTTVKYRTTGNWSSATGDTFTAGTDVCMTQARLKLYIWNGVDGGAYFDGSAVTRPGTMPKAKFSVYYQNKHIAAGVDGQPSRLYISNLTNASDFTVTTGGTQPQPDSTNDTENGLPNVPGATVFAGTPALTEANVIDIRKNDGDKITALGIFQDVLIAFKERAIYQITFDSSGNPTVTPVTYATGCISHRSVVNVENDMSFMSREGHRVLGNEPQFFTAIRTQVLSIRIQPSIDAINKQYYSRCNGIYFDNKYILSYPTGSSAIAKTLTYDRRFQAYSLWTNFNSRAMCRYIDSTNTEDLYFLDDGGTQVYKRVVGTYSDNGSAIEAYVVSKAQDVNNPDITKFWVDLRLIFRRLSGQITFTVYQDDGIAVGTAVIGSGSARGMGIKRLGVYALGKDGVTVSGTSTTTFVDNPQSVGLNLDSRTIMYKIYNNRVNENFVLLGTVYAYYPKSHYVFDSSRKIYL